MAVGADSIFQNSYGSEVPSGWMKWFQAGYKGALERVVQYDKEVGGWVGGWVG